MNEPLIPDAAYDAGEKAALPYVTPSYGSDHISTDAADVSSDVLRAAAPIIVAAELQALVDVLVEKHREMREEDGRALRSVGLSVAIDLLRTRGEELRSP